MVPPSLKTMRAASCPQNSTATLQSSPPCSALREPQRKLIAVSGSSDPLCDPSTTLLLPLEGCARRSHDQEHQDCSDPTPLAGAITSGSLA